MRCRPPGVAAEQRIPADDDQIPKHQQTIPDYVHLRRRMVCPAHRNLRDAQAVALGKEQDFRIESEALDALLFKDNPGRFTDKRFESALGIVKWQPREEPNKAVEDHSRKLAQP
jgi:hypothetical protein